MCDVCGDCSTCAENFETPAMLRRVLSWVEETVLRWLRSGLAPEEQSTTYLQWRTRLLFFVHESFGSLRCVARRLALFAVSGLADGTVRDGMCARARMQTIAFARCSIF
jgi:hypothetical protein